LDCASQRNLNKEGIEQAKAIGKFFSKNHIKNNIVLSSEWCRCKQTAKYAFKNYKTKNFLNSFYSKKFAHNKSNQINELKDYIQKWDGKSNLIFVTHYVVILEILNLSVSSGEIVVADKDFNILIRKKTTNN
jgi:phosphohistidine phosphatase SixA